MPPLAAPRPRPRFSGASPLAGRGQRRWQSAPVDHFGTDPFYNF